MDIKTFSEMLLEEMKIKFPDYYDKENFRLVEVPKANGVMMHGVVAPMKEEAAAQVTYINDMYEEYRKGRSLDTLVEEITAGYINNEEKAKTIKLHDVSDYSYCKDKLQIRIYDSVLNEERLKDKVHYVSGDFAVCYAVNITERNDVQSFLVTNEMLDVWKIKPADLHKDALLSDRKRGVRLYEMQDLIMSKFYMMEEPTNYFYYEGKVEKQIYVLTNPVNIYGSGLIENTDIRKRIAEVLDESFYVLPSSLHEVIILPESMGMDAEHLNEMVKSANETAVDISDFLSDKAQYCDKKTLGLVNAQLHELEVKIRKEEFEF